jgi:hypothetical protein
MLRRAQEVISSGSVPAVVDFGIELERVQRATTQELEEVKRFLRQIGETDAADRRTEKTVQIEGNLGVVTVTFPAEVLKIKAGVDLLACEEGIPEHVFKMLFTERTSFDLAEDFVEKLRTLDAETREMILNLLVAVRNTPRVNWPK